MNPYSTFANDWELDELIDAGIAGMSSILRVISQGSFAFKAGLSGCRNQNLCNTGSDQSRMNVKEKNIANRRCLSVFFFKKKTAGKECLPNYFNISNQI